MDLLREERRLRDRDLELDLEMDRSLLPLLREEDRYLRGDLDLRPYDGSLRSAIVIACLRESSLSSLSSSALQAQ